MRRTIELEEDQVRLLERIASEEGQSFPALVRQAIQEFLDYRQLDETNPTLDWNRRLEQLLSRVRKRTSAFSPEEIEADITAASDEVRQRNTYASRPH